MNLRKLFVTVFLITYSCIFIIFAFTFFILYFVSKNFLSGLSCFFTIYAQVYTQLAFTDLQIVANLKIKKIIKLSNICVS